MIPTDEWIFHFIEQHYLAEQAEVLLQQCLEQRTAAPLQNLVERLVVEGPQNLPALQLVHQLVAQRRAQVEEDALRLWEDLGDLLHRRGLHLPAATPWQALLLDAEAFRDRMLTLEGHPEPALLEESLKAFLNARSVLQDLYEAWRLLQELEEDLESWTWGLARLVILARPSSERVL